MTVSFASSFSAALAAPQPQPAVREAGIRQLENSWAQLDQDLRLLDQMLRTKPPGPQPPPSALALHTADMVGMERRHLSWQRGREA